MLNRETTHLNTVVLYILSKDLKMLATGSDLLDTSVQLDDVHFIVGTRHVVVLKCSGKIKQILTIPATRSDALCYLLSDLVYWCFAKKMRIVSSCKVYFKIKRCKCVVVRMKCNRDCLIATFFTEI